MMQAKNGSVRHRMYQCVENLQQSIIEALSHIDPTPFVADPWLREQGGGGVSKILRDGSVFEKAGVNVSSVYGNFSGALQNLLKVEASQFYACGVSLVIHPHSPKVPTVHANFRYFELYRDDAVVDSWFGGGADLTPYYIFDRDCTHFHRTYKRAMDAFSPSFYPDFKERCDRYFYNKHRKEARGIGGVFYDYMRPDAEKGADFWLRFQKAMGETFTEAYMPIVARRWRAPFTDDQKKWQEIRRGRYVEFNLIHDRGTHFGLKTDGRVESILMSLPPVVRWEYDDCPKDHSEESRLVEVLKTPKSWV